MRWSQINSAFWRGLLLLLLAVGLVAVFAPMSPRLPTTGVEDFWAFALNEAVARHLAFGRDIIFTYGPYASLMTHMYHPGTDRLMLGSGLLLGFCYAGLLLLLARGTRYPWLLAFLVFSLGCMVLPDPLFASYPLLLFLACYRLNLPEGNRRQLSLRRWHKVLLPILTLPLAVLALAKATQLFVCVLLGLLCAALFWRRGEKRLAVSLLLVPLLALPGFWCLAGQRLVDLPVFFASLGPIVGGYPQAMAGSNADGHVHEIFIYLIAAAGLLRWAWQQPAVPHRALVLAYAVFLFFAFKAGFVRHDAHAEIGGEALILLLLLSFFSSDVAVPAGVVLWCLLAWWACDEHVQGSSTRSIYAGIANTYRDFGRGLKQRLHQPQALPEQFQAGLADIQRGLPFQRRQGSMDIYPVEQTYIFTSGNAWAPRPVMQSYSAYTPELLQRNAAHLLGPGAPDNVLFRMAPLDNRLPALEEGLSWPLLIQGYRFDGFENHFMHFSKPATPLAVPAPQLLGRGEYRLGQDVIPPTAPGPLFARITLQTGIYGKMQAAVFRDAEVHISARLADGRTLDYGFVPNMAQTSFLLSPLIEDTVGFCHFALNDMAALQGQRVLSFRITTSAVGRLAWHGSYQVEWQQQNLNHAVDASLLPGCATLVPPPDGSDKGDPKK